MVEKKLQLIPFRFSMKRTIFRKEWDKYIGLRECLELQDGEYSIKPYSPPRNLEQNRLLHAYLSYIAQETGNDMEALKELMKKKFASKRKYVKLNGKKTFSTIIERTSEMNRKRFSEFFRDIELFFTELGYPLPRQDTPEWLNLIETYGN